MTRVEALVRRLRSNLLHSRPWPRRDEDFSIAVPFGYDRSPTVTATIAVIAHIFHAELSADFHTYCAAIPRPVKIFISTDTSEKVTAIESAFSSWPQERVEIRLVPNRGRDIAPKFVTFADVFEKYDLVLCIHSKKSSYLNSDQNWRDVLFQALVGSAAVVNSILALFEEDSRLGIVFPQHYDGIRDRIAWGANRVLAGELADRMGIPLSKANALEFISGSMFWARSAALRPLLALALTVDDFPPEEGQLDGTLGHAIERLLLYAAEHAGFFWLKVARPECYANRQAMLSINRPEDIGPAMRRARFSLLPRHESSR